MPLFPARGHQLAPLNLQTQYVIASVIFVVAVGVRLLVAWEISYTPFFSIYMGDALHYHEWALSLAAGKSDNTVFFQAPLYPYFLGALYRVFSPDPWTPRIAQAILAGAGCALLSLSAFRLFGRRAGWIVGLLSALYTPSLFYDLLAHKSGIALILGSLIVFSVTRFLTGNRTMPATVAIGSVTALAAMAIEHYLIVLPVLGAWMFMHRAVSWQQRMRWVGGLLLGVSLVQLPVIARNYWVANDPVVASASAGLNFWIGNGRGSTGLYREISVGRGTIQFEQKDSERIASRALKRQVSSREASQWWFDRALREIVAQPGAWLKVMARKAGFVLGDYEWQDQDAYGAYVSESRILNAFSGILRFGLLLPLFAIGAVAMWNTKEESRPFITAAIAILGGVMLFFVFGRYRYAAMPFMFVVAGSGLAILTSVNRGKLLCLVGVAAGAIAFLPINTSMKNPALNYYMVGMEAANLNRLDVAKNMLLRSIQLAPDGADYYMMLAAVYRQNQELELAEATLRQLIAINPEFPDAHRFLGEILARVGDLHARAGDVDGAIKFYSEVLSMEGANDVDRQYARSCLERFAR